MTSAKTFVFRALFMSTHHGNTVAFSGHRPEKLHKPIGVLSKKLDETLLMLYEQGFRTFLSGMARGFDMLVAEAVLRLREKHHYVKLVAVIPFMGQELMYSKMGRERYDVHF